MYCAQAELLDEFTANRALNICQMGVELGVIVREVLLRIAPKCLMAVLVFFVFYQKHAREDGKIFNSKERLVFCLIEKEWGERRWCDDGTTANSNIVPEDLNRGCKRSSIW